MLATLHPCDLQLVDKYGWLVTLASFPHRPSHGGSYHLEFCTSFLRQFSGFHIPYFRGLPLSFHIYPNTASRRNFFFSAPHKLTSIRDASLRRKAKFHLFEADVSALRPFSSAHTVTMLTEVLYTTNNVRTRYIVT